MSFVWGGSTDLFDGSDFLVGDSQKVVYVRYVTVVRFQHKLFVGIVVGGNGHEGN